MTPFVLGVKLFGIMGLQPLAMAAISHVPVFDDKAEKAQEPTELPP